jgi:hypothetical protein
VDARDAYAKVKQEAAQVWSDDRIAYTEAKTGVALDLLDAAEIWAMANSWAVIHPPGVRRPRPRQTRSANAGGQARPGSLLI